METILHFRGNIEGDFAVCNISEPSKHSTKPNEMYIPAEFCSEHSDCEIHVSKRHFNRLEKAGKITYKTFKSIYEN